jgi:hypothetical protein
MTSERDGSQCCHCIQESEPNMWPLYLQARTYHHYIQALCMRCTIPSNSQAFCQSTSASFWLRDTLLKRFQPQVRKLSLKNDVWCVKNGAKGRTVCIGVPTAKLDCVWIPASKFFTPWITSKFQPLKIVSIYIYQLFTNCNNNQWFNNYNRKFYKIWFSSFFSKLNFMKS